MTKKTLLPSRPRHIRLYDEDWNFLENYYGRGSSQPIGTTQAVRGIVHAFVGRLKAKYDALPDAERTSAGVLAACDDEEEESND
jgi:hypothetical protein